MLCVKKALGLRDPVNPSHNNVNIRQDLDPTVLDWLKEVCPSGRQLLRYFIRLFPFLRWIQHYNLQWLLGDLTAGTQTPLHAKIHERCSNEMF
jgi:solute carrier family 26 (sodium-independent sulfate anion transporter), member 11